MTYIGRFAPTPSGPLHFGSLLTAVASYCDAKFNNGNWLLRIENTDLPRNQIGADTLIKDDLERLGLYWDGDTVSQLERLDIYNEVLQYLSEQSYVYGCVCTRKELEGYEVYPSFCRNKHFDLLTHTIRLNVPDSVFSFNDVIQGDYSQNIAQSVGDFVLKRRDGIINYQLAVVVDDILTNVSHVVRGVDLIDNTPRQLYLQHLLAPLLNPCYQTPIYAHIPLALNAEGQKLSKQNKAKALNINEGSKLLALAINSLGQQPVEMDKPENMLKQAISQWDITAIPKRMAIDGVYN